MGPQIPQMNAERPYAWMMAVTKHDLSTEEIVRVAKTERRARRLAMLRPLALSVEIISTFTEKEYRALYGTRRVRAS